MMTGIPLSTNVVQIRRLKMWILLSYVIAVVIWTPLVFATKTTEKDCFDPVFNDTTNNTGLTDSTCWTMWTPRLEVGKLSRQQVLGRFGIEKQICFNIWIFFCSLVLLFIGLQNLS